MDAQDKRRELAAELTRELSGDPELRRDVCRELECHLEDGVAAARRRGVGEAEAEAAALEDFGPASGLPQMLVEGNLNRMQSRAKLKLLLEWGLIPLALLAALILGGREFLELYRVREATKHWYAHTAAESRAPVYADEAPQNLEERQALAIENYRSARGNEQALAAVKQLDPDNGLVELEVLHQSIRGKAPRDWRQYEAFMKTWRESDDFLKTMDELEPILAKPVLSSRYHTEAQRQIRSIEKLGLSRTLEKIQAVSVSAQSFFTAFGSTRELGNALGRRAVFAHLAGREDEADRALRLMEKLMQSLVLKDEPSLIHILVVSAVPGELLKEPDFVKLLESSPSRRALGERLRQVCDLCDKWRKKLEVERANSAPEWQEKASIEARMLLSALGAGEIPTEEILAPSRNAEYRFLDKWLVIMTLSGLFLLLAFLLIAPLTQRRRLGSEGFLPLPRLKDLCRHVALTLVLPVLIFELFKLTPWSSHAWSLPHSAAQYIFEQLVLWALILPISWAIWQRSCTKRLRALGLEPAKNPGFNWWLAVVFGGIGLLGLLGFAFETSDGRWLRELLGLELLQKLSPTPTPILGFMVTCGVLTLLSLGALLWRFFRRDGLLFRLCLARSLAVLLAFQVLALSAYVALLRAEEAHYHRQDSTFQADANGFNRIESELVRSWRDKLKEIWR
ncbi:MAG: hypothetical protein RL095_3744 [Verrucomicrobiota bacterium]|jgi:hypothetical protein